MFTVSSLERALSSLNSTVSEYCAQEFSPRDGRRKACGLLQQQRTNALNILGRVESARALWCDASYQFLQCFEYEMVPMMKFIEVTCSTPKTVRDLTLILSVFSNTTRSVRHSITWRDGWAHYFRSSNNFHTDSSVETFSMALWLQHCVNHRVCQILQIDDVTAWLEAHPQGCGLMGWVLMQVGMCNPTNSNHLIHARTTDQIVLNEAFEDILEISLDELAVFRGGVKFFELFDGLNVDILKSILSNYGKTMAEMNLMTPANLLQCLVDWTKRTRDPKSYKLAVLEFLCNNNRRQAMFPWLSPEELLSDMAPQTRPSIVTSNDIPVQLDSITLFFKERGIDNQEFIAKFREEGYEPAHLKSLLNDPFAVDLIKLLKGPQRIALRQYFFPTE
jgi:hypothetical protein